MRSVPSSSMNLLFSHWWKLQYSNIRVFSTKSTFQRTSKIHIPINPFQLKTKLWKIQCRYFHGRNKKKLQSESLQMSVTAEVLMEKGETTSNGTFQNDQMQQLSKNVEEMDDLLQSKLALDDTDSQLVFESEITDEELANYVKKKQLEQAVTYGSATDSLEQVTGLGDIPVSTSLDDKSIYLYGTPDPTVPITDVPCAGCGAMIHCQDSAIPGYMPSQKLKLIPKKDLRNQICQRCFMMEEHDLALNLKVDPTEYTDIVGQIKHKKALVILVVDVTDFPNSVYKDLPRLIGHRRPLFVVGNKADLLPKDTDGYLDRTKEMIEKYLDELGFSRTNYIKHVSLISAKTGYGVEELVSTLMTEWNRKGDVYVVGCTNVGKSTLFNSLLSSDYCKNTARDFIHRATVSNWPGTTLNTLKFPIISPAGWRLQKRAERLSLAKEKAVEEFILQQSKQSGKRPKFESLMGHIGQTFLSTKEKTLSELDYQGCDTPMYSLQPQTGTVQPDSSKTAEKLTNQVKRETENYDESAYDRSWWCYDTPGVVNTEQIINLLTQHELTMMLTMRLILPRTFRLYRGMTVFVTGLGRIDYLKGEEPAYFTVLCSMKLPVHVVTTAEADDFYAKNVGTETLTLPMGDEERMNKLPSLIGREFSMTGIGSRTSMADILLSSLGWVSVTARESVHITVRAYTPGGYGCKLRTPSLLCHAVQQRGKKIRKTHAYNVKPPVM